MNDHHFEVFVDGGCSMCSREARWMRKLDRGRGRLKVTDIGSPAYFAAVPDLPVDDAMRSIHGRYPDGRVVHGVEVFRAAYAALGLGWLWAPTRWPVVRQIVDALYAVFARARYRARRRAVCNLETQTSG